MQGKSVNGGAWGRGVRGVRVKIGAILRGKIGAMSHEEIFGVTDVGSAGEIVRTGEHPLRVEDQNLVMGDVMPGVDFQVDARIKEESNSGAAHRTPRLVEDHMDGASALLRGDDGANDRHRIDQVGLAIDRRFGVGDGGNDRVFAVATGRKADLNWAVRAGR